jgi:CxxC-x17-CxxC domain-containing protein
MEEEDRMEEDENKAPEEEAVSEDKEENLESEEPQEESEEDSEESEEGSEDKEDDREMHKATCAECGEECEVPFKPEEGRDVFCSDCFRKRRKPRRSFGGGRGRGFGGGRGGGFRREREMHDATCAECGKECQVPFKPSGDKPVLCKDCYMKAR